MDFNAIVTGVVTGALALGGSVAHSRSMFKKTGAKIVEELKAAWKIGGVVVKDAEAIAKSPLVKAAETELAHKLTSQLRTSEIGRLAAVALHGAQKALDDLSAEEKQAIALWVTKHAPADWKLTEKEVLDAIAQAQKEADAVAAWDVFQFSAKLSEAKKAAEKVTPLAPAKEEATATA